MGVLSIIQFFRLCAVEHKRNYAVNRIMCCSAQKKKEADEKAIEKKAVDDTIVARGKETSTDYVE